MAKTGKPGYAEEFAARTGYTFDDPELLLGALTHPSYSGTDAQDYQRLEFLGDRVLGLVVAEDLYRRFPDSNEGDLARQFNYLVRKQTCAAAARTIDLGSLIRSQGTGKGVSTRILGDACEAIIAAVYLDGGFVAATRLIHSLWQSFLAQSELATRDAKSLLQEWSLARALGVPNYKVVSRTGPDHAPTFQTRVDLPGYEPALGEANSKRNAEQAAAKAFMDANEIEAT